jgi:hypothetical protein
MLINAQLASRIGDIIRRRKLSQAQAAEVLGIPQPKRKRQKLWGDGEKETLTRTVHENRRLEGSGDGMDGDDRGTRRIWRRPEGAVQIEKGFERLASGEIGLSIDDGKRIMSALQEVVVKQELATYALARRVCEACERLRPVKDYTMRKIRTVFGTVAVKNPLDGLPALLSPLFHGLHGSRGDLPGPGHTRTHGAYGALGKHVAVSQGCGAPGGIPAH